MKSSYEVDGEVMIMTGGDYWGNKDIVELIAVNEALVADAKYIWDYDDAEFPPFFSVKTKRINYVGS